MCVWGALLAFPLAEGEEAPPFFCGPLAEALGVGFGEGGFAVEEDVFGFGHASDLDVGAGCHEKADGFFEFMAGLIGPFGEVHDFAGFYDVFGDHPGGGGDVAIPRPAGLVGVAIAAGAVEESADGGSDFDVVLEGAGGIGVGIRAIDGDELDG